MALPRVNMGGINQAWGQASQAQQGAYDRLASLGQQINNSILEQNLAKEAQEMAPVIGQEYQSAFQAIEQGDISGGLSRIYQTNAQVSRNPILARQSQEITKAAEMMSQDYMRTRLQQNQIDATNQRFAYGQEQQNMRQDESLDRMDARQQAGFEQQEKIAKLSALAKKDPKEMTWGERGVMTRFGFEKMDETLKYLEENPDDVQGQEQRIQFLGTLLSNIKKTNPHLSEAENMEFMTTKDREDLGKLEDRLIEYQEKAKSGGKDEGWFGSGKDYKDLVTDIQKEIGQIKKRAKSFYGARGVDLDKADDGEPGVDALQDPMAEEVANVNSVEPELPTKELSFGSEAEAESAFTQGKIKTGDTVVIGGKKFKIGQ